MRCLQAGLLAEAEAFRDAHIVDVTSYEELQQAVAEGAQHGWQPCDV